MIAILTSPLFYIFITIGIYILFAFLQKKYKTAIFNPLLWTIVFVIGYILLIILIDKGSVNTEYIEAEVTRYQSSTQIFDILLAPVTVALALPLYLNRKMIKENIIPIIVATIVGVASSFLSVWLLSMALDIQKDIMKALLPRGVTTAIAKEITILLGSSDWVSITISIVALSGIVGAVLGPLLIKLFRDKDDVLVGLSLGSASHAIGTSRAFQYSEKAGSIASIAIITNGLVSVLTALVLYFII